MNPDVQPPATASPDAVLHGLTGWVTVDGETETYVATSGNGSIGRKDFYIRGEAPFTCVRRPGKVTITAEGRRRVFQMPIPQNIVPSNLLPSYATAAGELQT